MTNHDSSTADAATAHKHRWEIESRYRVGRFMRVRCEICKRWFEFQPGKLAAAAEKRKMKVDR